MSPPNPQQLLLVTVPGLETVAAAELTELRPDAVLSAAPVELSGFVDARLEFGDDLLGLTTVQHLIELRGTARGGALDDVKALVSAAEFPELAAARSFRVTAERHGDHEFNRVDVQRAAGGILHRRYGTSVDLEEFELEVHVHVSGPHLFAGIRRTPHSLDRRIRRAANLRSALKPTVAAAMLRLVGAHRGEGRLLDPMCGTATIPVEAKRVNPRLEVAASDWDPPTLEIARGTVANHELEIDVRQVDARALAASYPGRFHYIVTDLPYGVRQAKHAGRAALYSDLLASFREVLGDAGRIAVVVLKRRTFMAAVEKAGLDVEHEQVVQLGTITPRIVLLRHPVHRGFPDYRHAGSRLAYKNEQ